MKTKRALRAGAVVAALASTLVVGLPAASAQALPGKCSINGTVWHQSTNYRGYTAGQSWAWNVTMTKGYSGPHSAYSARVKEIQCLIAYRHKFYTDGKMNFTPDGIFHESTRQLVIRFQKEKGLTADGIVGPATWRKARIGGAIVG